MSTINNKGIINHGTIIGNVSNRMTVKIFAHRSHEKQSREQIHSRQRIRNFLWCQIEIDSDFDAFCLDNFPDVFRNFSDGMTRNRKINLLLNSVPASLIQAAVTRHCESKA